MSDRLDVVETRIERIEEKIGIDAIEELEGMFIGMHAADAPDDIDGDYIVYPDDDGGRVPSRNLKSLGESDRFAVRYLSWEDSDVYQAPCHLVVEEVSDDE